MSTSRKASFAVQDTGRRIWLGLVIASLLSMLLPFLTHSAPSLSVFAGWCGDICKEAYCIGQTHDSLAITGTCSRAEKADGSQVAVVAIVSMEGIVTYINE